MVGQKSYNGVAALARVPFTVVHRALPGLPADDTQARYIEIEAAGTTVIGIYLPNGNSRGDDGFADTLAWMDHLAEQAESLLETDTGVPSSLHLKSRTSGIKRSKVRYGFMVVLC